MPGSPQHPFWGPAGGQEQVSRTFPSCPQLPGSLSQGVEQSLGAAPVIASPIPSKWQQLEQLAAALCDGEITVSQSASLERLICRSKEARRHFLAFVQMHGMLGHELAGSGCPEAANDPISRRPHARKRPDEPPV